MSLSIFRTAIPLTGLLVASCVGSYAEAGSLVKGRIYAGEAAMDTPLFYYENTRSEEEGKSYSKTRYTDPQGKVLVDEEVIFEGGKLKQYRYNQLQTDERGTIEVQDGKVSYVFVHDNTTDSGEDSWNDAMVVPDMIEQKISQNWATLLAGDDLKIRFLALEAQDNFGFKIFKSGEGTLQGKPTVELVMKASGFFVALAAPSFKITVEKEAPHRILKMDGRLPVRMAKRTPPQSRSDLKAMDGVLVLDHVEAPAASSSAGASGAGAGSSAGAASGAASGAKGASPRPSKGSRGRGAAKPGSP